MAISRDFQAGNHYFPRFPGRKISAISWQEIGRKSTKMTFLARKSLKIVSSTLKSRKMFFPARKSQKIAISCPDIAGNCDILLGNPCFLPVDFMDFRVSGLVFGCFRLGA